MLSNDDFNFSLKAVTWFKDAHGLFDYESNETNENTYKLDKEGGNLIRVESDNMLKYVSNKKEDSFFLTGSDATQLTVKEDSITTFYNKFGSDKIFSNIQEKYDFTFENIHIVQYKLWNLVGQKEIKGIKKMYISNTNYDFALGDLVRFGRMQFVVSDLFIKDKTKDSEKSLDINNIDKYIFKPQELGDYKNKQCIICEKKEMNENDPIIKICGKKCCAKNEDYFHINCYKELIKHNEIYGYKENNFNNKNLLVISIYNLICPKCKNPINFFMKKNSKIINVLPYVLRKDQSYLVLNSLNFFKENVLNTIILVFHFPSKSEEFFLGRGHEATFKLSDISISRVHCKIFVNNNKISLHDLGSKFGTLFLIREDIALDDMVKDKMKIECGRSVFWLEK